MKKDATQAFMWYMRAADLKDVRAITDCGAAYLNGEGVERSEVRGCTMLGMAAVLGSELACGILGHANEHGFHGLDKNPQEATRWYREMQKCHIFQGDGAAGIRKQATAWLREHP